MQIGLCAFTTGSKLFIRFMFSCDDRHDVIHLKVWFNPQKMMIECNRHAYMIYINKNMLVPLQCLVHSVCLDRIECFNIPSEKIPFDIIKNKK